MVLRARRRRSAELQFDDLYIAADLRRLAPTRAEAELERILDTLGNGALRGEYKREWPVGEWWVDFYFPAIRLAIEVDGGYHRAQSRWRQDWLKAAQLEAQGITLLRLTNTQVFGDRVWLVQSLRTAWRTAARRANCAREGRAAYRVAFTSFSA